jgi:hypothetical protein
MLCPHGTSTWTITCGSLGFSKIALNPMVTTKV